MILGFNVPIIYTWNVVECVYLHTADFTQNKIWFYLERKMTNIWHANAHLNFPT